MGSWLHDSHIDEVLALKRLRQTNNGDLLYPNCAITDVAFGQMLVSTYRNLLKKAIGTSVAKGGKRKRSGTEDLDCVPNDFKFDDKMMQYVMGDRPKYGHSWAKVKSVYCIIMVKEMHWIAVVALLKERLLKILDCNPIIYRDRQLEAELEPLSVLFPRLLHDSGMFEHLGGEALIGKLPLKRVLVPTNKSSADCGAYALKFIQFDMTNTPMDGLNDETMTIFRERWAVECFHGEMDLF